MRKLAAVLLAMTASTALPAQTILVHGHRGTRALRPENTIPAFTYAIEHHADVLELDLAVTRDNQLVVSHSPFLVQPSGQVTANERQCLGPVMPPGTTIRSLTLAEIKQFDCGSKTLANFPRQVAVPGTRIPTFDEVLDLATHGAVDFNVETKIFPNHPELTPTPEVFVQMIYDAIKRHHVDESRIILQSFDFRTLQAMKKLDPSIRLSALFGPEKYDAMMGMNDPDKTFAHIAAVSGANILSPDQSLVTPAEVDAAHKLGLQVAPYTADTPEQWRRLADAHVDAIITDDPEALLAWLRSQKPPLHP